MNAHSTIVKRYLNTLFNVKKLLSVKTSDSEAQLVERQKPIFIAFNVPHRAHGYIIRNL